METGQRVRIKANPGRIGYCTGKTMERGGRRLTQVRFSDATQYYPEDELEIIPIGKQHPLDLLDEGRIGRASDLRRLLTHVKLSGRLANLLYSMEVTNTDFYAYQFKPVLKMLNSVGNGILIADEVGLGKTIEAGLIWTELRTRFDYKRLMILCPAFLREKWQRELHKRFGVRAEILDARGVYQTLKASAAEGQAASFAIIASMQGLRPQKGWEDEDEENQTPSARLASFLRQHQHDAPLIDLLIIDEAHYLRIPDLRHPDKKTAILGRLLRDVSEHVVLLSATPIHLRSQDLYQLLNIVDDATFNQPAVFDEILNANAPLLRARESLLKKSPSVAEFKAALEEALSHPLLKGNRQLTALLESLPNSDQLADPRFKSELAYRLDTINLLGHVIARTRKRDVTEWRVLREAIPEIVPLTPPEREFYDAVTETVREFCAEHMQHEGFILTTPQRQMSSSMPAALLEWKRRSQMFTEELYEDYGASVIPDDLVQGPVITQLISQVERFGDLHLLWKNDSKYNRLRSVIQKYLNEHHDEKVVLFSYFRATLDYLHERLTEDGISSIVLKGGPDQPKDDILNRFASPEGPSVLLSSEVGSEGIDLQFCRVLINYDLPWNPMKVEQRIGRIDRLGQKSQKITIWNLFYEDTIDARIYQRLHERLEIFKYALGGFEPILGEHIQKLTLDLLLERLTPEQETERIEQTAQALMTIRRHEEELEQQAAHLVAYGDYILNQVKAARELNRWVTGKDIQVYVMDFFKLNYPGCEFLQHDDDALVFKVLLTNYAKQDLENYIKDHRVSTTTRLVRSDPNPVICRFENKINVEDHPRTEIIHQAHPLVRFVSSRINAQDEQYYPAVSVMLDVESLSKQLPTGIYVFTIQHWSVKGLQEIEKLYYAAARMSPPCDLLPEEDAERLITSAAVHGKDWLEAKNVVDLKAAWRVANGQCLQLSDQRYEEFITDLKNQNQDRADLQEKTLNLHLQNQISKLTEVKNRHFQAGRESLAKATEGRISALKNRFERKKIEIDQRRIIVPDKNEICVGLIKLVVLENA